MTFPDRVDRGCQLTFPDQVDRGCLCPLGSHSDLSQLRSLGVAIFLAMFQPDFDRIEFAFVCVYEQVSIEIASACPRVSTAVLLLAGWISARD